MAQMMAKFGLSFEYMLQGDIADFSPELLEKYFDEAFVRSHSPAVVSCALKHLLIYEKMLADGVDNALILEDDVFLMPNFTEVFNRSMAELKATGMHDVALINYENSTLQFAADHSSAKDKVLFQAEKSRCAAAYFLSHALAKEIVAYTREHKCNRPIDWYHNTLIGKIELQHFWCHPPIVEQGSHNGKIPSLLDQKRTGLFRQISWRLQKFYKSSILPLFKH